MRKGSCFRIGNGLRINIWKDPQSLNLPDKVPKARDGVDFGRLEKVVDLKELNGMGWNESLIRGLFYEEIAQIILKIEWQVSLNEDKVLWCGNPKGCFLVGNCYEVNCNSPSSNDEIWNMLRKAHIHERLKVFAWRALANVLPSKEILSERIRFGNPSCDVCGANVELIFHILKECPRSRAIAFSNKQGAMIDGWPGGTTKELIDVCLNPQDLCNGCLDKDFFLLLFFCFSSFSILLLLDVQK